MSNQPAPARPWFRLPSIARPTAPTTTPTPEPPPPQPRPALARPAFRPIAPPQPVPTQPRETTPAATGPQAVAAPPPEPVPPVSGVASVPTSPVARAAGGVASVPTSPTSRAPAPSSSVPTSPVPTSAVLPLTTSSLPPSPTPKPAPTYSSVPTSPATKPVTSTSSVPTSPAPKPVTTTSPVPTTSPVKTTSPVPNTSPVPTSYASKSVTVTSSVQNSPATKAVTTNATRVPSPGPYPRTIKPAFQTPPQSPKPKPTAPPPSPLTLPPSQVKSYAELEPKIPLVAEQKTVLVQKTFDKPKVARDSQRDFTDSHSSGIARLAKQETTKDFQTKEKGNRKKNSSDSEDVGMKVITIAGENKGAFMEVIRSPKKQVFEGTSRFLHRKGNPKSEGSDSSSSEEGNSKKKDKNPNGKAMGPSPLSSFMNSNVQGVNNSIVYNSSCSHHDPGVHVAFSRKPAGAAAFHVKDHGYGNQS